NTAVSPTVSDRFVVCVTIEGGVGTVAGPTIRNRVKTKYVAVELPPEGRIWTESKFVQMLSDPKPFVSPTVMLFVNPPPDNPTVSELELVVTRVIESVSVYW